MLSVMGLLRTLADFASPRTTETAISIGIFRMNCVVPNPPTFLIYSAKLNRIFASFLFFSMWVTISPDDTNALNSSWFTKTPPINSINRQLRQTQWWCFIILSFYKLLERLTCYASCQSSQVRQQFGHLPLHFPLVGQHIVRHTGISFYHLHRVKRF